MTETLKAIRAQESFEEAAEKAESVAAELAAMKLKEAAKCVRDGVAETLTYTRFPWSTGGASAPTTP